MRGEQITKLTKRQIDVLRLIAEGKSSKEIAVEMEISPRTVSVHRDELFKRLGVHGAVNAVKQAHILGVL